MEKYSMAYCPTMEPFAKIIENKFENIETIPANSAAEVLYMLRSNQVDSVLIGRTAKKREIDSQTKFFRLKGGITLAFKGKYAIPVEQLKEAEAITYLEQEKVADVKKYFGKIHFLPTLEECLKYNLDIPTIVDWEDFDDSFELLIPMNETGKVPEFRAPVIYYKNFYEEQYFSSKLNLNQNV